MRIKYTISIGLVGCKRERVIEVDDESSDNDIWEVVQEDAMQRVDVDWVRVPEQSK